MTKIGVGLPGHSVEDVERAAEAAALYGFDSFSVYQDLGDRPAYAVLHAVADRLRGTSTRHVGPMGVPVGMQHAEVIAGHALTLDEQLPGQSSIGLVRGAFLEAIGEKPASLEQMKETVVHVRQLFTSEERETPPLYIGGFGPKLLGIAGELAVQGVKLGGSTNPAMAGRARELIDNPSVEIVLGAVSVIDENRKAARTLARTEVAKYLAVVGRLDTTLNRDELDSLTSFQKRFAAGDRKAPNAISDALLDKFAVAGTPDDALEALARMDGVVDRFEFGTPHGLDTSRDRAAAIHYIGQSIVNTIGV